jgi:hypothetical protein
MAYSAEKFKSNDSKASPCFRPFYTGNVSYKYLHIQISLYIPFKHILMGLTSITGISNLIQNIVSFLTES